MPKLFKTEIASDANLKVFVTDVRSEADLVVFETPNAWDATQGPIWCYTNIRGEADKVVFFTPNKWDADLVIWKTDVQSDAGWNDNSKAGLL